MRLLTFALADGAVRPGAATDDGILDLGALAAARGGVVPLHLSSLLALLDAGPAALDEVRSLVSDAPSLGVSPLAAGAARLLAPLPRPRSIRDCMAFEAHIIQSTRGGADMLYPPVGSIDRGLARVFGRGFLGVSALHRQIPAYYKGNPASVVGPEAEVEWPAYTERLDYELEMGVYIGRPGRDIPADRAMEHVAGFTIFNDFSARDAQLREMKLRLGPAKGKDFDTGNAMGPYLVTPDEIPDPYALRMIARVDGEVWTDARSDGMMFTIPEILSYVSQGETLHPGDFIGFGTVGGGCGLEHGRWLSPGQRVELEVDLLGILANTIVRRERPHG